MREYKKIERYQIEGKVLKIIYEAFPFIFLMKRAPHCSTKLWKKDLHVRDTTIREHGGYEGLKNAEKYVENMFGGRCKLDYLKGRISALNLKPTRIAKRRKDMLILWIYDNRELIKRAIAMQTNNQVMNQSFLLPELEEDEFSIFNSFETIQI